MSRFALVGKNGCARSRHSFAVTTFQECNSGGFRGVLVFVVEQEILVEFEPSRPPFTDGVGGFLVEVAAERMLLPCLASEVQQLRLVHSDGFLHTSTARINSPLPLSNESPFLETIFRRRSKVFLEKVAWRVSRVCRACVARVSRRYATETEWRATSTQSFRARHYLVTG